MAGQSSAALGVAKLLVGEANITRVSPVVARGRFTLDSAAEIASLEGLGRHEARHRIEQVTRDFLSTPAEGFVPFHAI